MINPRDLEFLDELIAAGDEQGAQAWLALGREGRELYWKATDSFEQSKTDGKEKRNGYDECAVNGIGHDSSRGRGEPHYPTDGTGSV